MPIPCRGLTRWVLPTAVTLCLLLLGASTAAANTIGPGLGPSPTNPITYQPMKHICVSPEPMQLCQDFTVDINTSMNGSVVSLLYTQSYFCDLAIRSRAATGCEFGERARNLPPGVAGWRYTDPLFLMFPSGPLLKELGVLKPECQFAGHCTDHPSTVDFSRILGPATGNMLLPVHDHFETTRNGNRPEWHPLYAFFVSSLASWERAVASHDVRTLYTLAKTSGSGVSGPYPSNIFFFFQVLPGSPTAQEIAWAQLPHPFVTEATQQDPSIIGTNDSLMDHVVGVVGNTLQAFFGSAQRQLYRLTPAG